MSNQIQNPNVKFWILNFSHSFEIWILTFGFLLMERGHWIDEEEFWPLDGYGETLEELRNKFVEYLYMYNSERTHWALGGKTPL